MKLGICEVLEMAAKEKSVEDKVTVLHINDSPQLRKMIKYILDPNVVWWEFLRGTPPPYKPNRYIDAEGRLFQELRILYMFCEGGDEWMGITNDQYRTRAVMQNNPKKRQDKWIQLLEGVTAEDAILLLSAPFREFPFDGLPREVIDEAFPGLLSPEPVPGQAPVVSTVPVEAPPSHGIPPQRPPTEIVELSIEDILGDQVG